MCNGNAISCFQLLGSQNSFEGEDNDDQATENEIMHMLEDEGNLEYVEEILNTLKIEIIKL